MGRMLCKSASGRALLMLAYDKNGNQIRLADVTGKVTEYHFDPLDILKEVYDNGEKLAEYRHTPGGMLLSQRHGPLQVSYGYDRDKNLTALKSLSGDEILSDNLYEYDGNGNRTKKRQMEGETQYIFDGLNQLTKIEYPTLTEELFYDKAGNRTRRIAGDEEDLYSYDPRNRLVSHICGGVTTPLVYDDAGNLLRDGRAIYEYDGFNRAVKAETFDGNIQVNRYDAEGLRYELEENGRLVQFIFHRGDAVIEQNETDTIRLIRGYDLIASDAQSARTYYHYTSDEVGSTTHIVDETGKVLDRYVYDAFGNITEQEETVPNRFKFNGQQFDPITQQYYLRARFYNPVVARFTQEDVYRGDGLNLYAYYHNNPVVYADPSGYSCISEEDLIAGQRDGQLALPAPEQQLALPSPNDISQRRLQSGEIYQDSAGRWRDNRGYVATPTSALPPQAPKPTTGGPPNPYGQKGSPTHQAAADSAQPMHGGTIIDEYRFDTPYGEKAYRQADRVEIVGQEVVTIYQAGRVDAQGLPVTRESIAIADIMGSPDYNGAPIIFIPYNSNQGPITYLP